MFIHLIFDWLSYLVSFLVYRLYFKSLNSGFKGDFRVQYITVVIIGFVIGAVIFSTINNYLSIGIFIVGKSLIGAIFGAIIAIEIFKYFNDTKSTVEVFFVPSWAIGIAVGRLGCYFAGLQDYTYGIATTLPWGVDFGDGIKRHPVQLYESFSMFIFFIFSMVAYKRNLEWFKRYIFYYFILFYAIQRFAWELLKPYAKIGYFNIFGWLCIALIIYAIYKISRN